MTGVADEDLSAVELKTNEIRAALALAKVRVYEDLSAELVPPAALIFAPRLTFGAGGYEPVEATYPLMLVVADDAKSIVRLMRLLPAVAEAIHENVNNAVVRDDAEPGAFNSGGTLLPCYQITVDAAL